MHGLDHHLHLQNVLVRTTLVYASQLNPVFPKCP